MIIKNLFRRGLSDEEMTILYEDQGRYLYNLCYRHLNCPSSADDVVQITFIKAFENWHQLKNKTAVRGWLRTIAVRQCLKMLKSKELLTEEFKDTNPLTVEYRASSLGISEINEAICALPTGCRMVFSLYQLENLSHQEIADTLGVSLSTSKSQYQRARSLLQERLKTSYYDQ